MSDLKRVISDNINGIRERIESAAVSAGRQASEVTLVGVTKYVAPPLARLVVESGVADLGESRPQALLQKEEALRDLPNVRWHLIGQLQRNKVRRVITLAHLIHSADRWKLLRTLHQVAEELDIEQVDVLLEVNISEDETKHGFQADSLPEVLDQLGSIPRIQVAGLMAMAGRTASDAQVQRQFAACRELRDQLVANSPANAPLHDLSMGMSGDYELGIKEGATIVRIGSGLFEGLAND